MTLKFVTRAEWGARPPDFVARGGMSAESTCHWNGPIITIGGSAVWDHKYCASIVRGIQNFHMDGRGWSDIAYNFVECPHGYTFEGRGLDVYNGANGTNTGNKTSHAVMCLAGEGNPHPEAEKVGFKAIVLFISQYTNAPNDCIGHRDHKSTACPGDVRYNWVHAGMPVPGTAPTPTPPPSSSTGEEDDNIMQPPYQIVKGDAKPYWFVTDGVTKQWVNSRPHAAILILNFGAGAQTKPTSMAQSELDKIAPYTWPQSAVDGIRLVGVTPS